MFAKDVKSFFFLFNIFIMPYIIFIIYLSPSSFISLFLSFFHSLHHKRKLLLKQFRGLVHIWQCWTGSERLNMERRHLHRQRHISYSSGTSSGSVIPRVEMCVGGLLKYSTSHLHHLCCCRFVSDTKRTNSHTPKQMPHEVSPPKIGPMHRSKRQSQWAECELIICAAEPFHCILKFISKETVQHFGQNDY